MTTHLAEEPTPEDESQCWCCGATQPSNEMVRLGAHPEVTLCLRCAHFVHRRAQEIEDRGRTGLGARTRDVVRGIRGQVIQHGWQHNRVLGPPMRWIDRHLP
jgi:hypothetical protein